MKSRSMAMLTCVCLALGAFLIWRTSLPNNQFRPGRALFSVHTDERDYFLPQPFHDYDDIVTVMTTHRFVRDGFWRTHGLPNRTGVPATAFHDFRHDQCQQLSSHQVMQYRHRGVWMPMHSIDGDCIYTHYPPGGDWFFSLVALTGFDKIWHYKLVAILLNIGLLAATYFWLRREVVPLAALFTTTMIGTSPAFLNWADALLYHPLQYLFLVLGLLTWGQWLRNCRCSVLWLTWCLYFAECLVSYELTLFFGLMVIGMTCVEHGFASWRRFWRTWSVQATAPALAFAVQIAMSVSLFGLERATHNLRATVTDRMIRGTFSGLLLLHRRAGEDIMPWLMILIAFVGFALLQRAQSLPIRRAIITGTLLLVAGMSFAIAMPGTASYHFAMMHRHFWPFMAFAMAVTLDGSFKALAASKRDLSEWSHRRSKWATLAAVPLLLPGSVAWHNANNIVNEVRGNRANNRQHEPSNLARSALDTLYWRDSTDTASPASFLPISGVRRYEPRRWLTDLRIRSGAPSHYEVWWIDPVRVRRIRLLLDKSQLGNVATECFLSAYQDGRFVPLPARTSSRSQPFVADANDSRRRLSYAWFDIQAPEPLRTRSIRLTCNATTDIALHQWEAYAD